MKKQLLLMLSLGCVAYNLGMSTFAQRLINKDDAAALETVKKVEGHHIELSDFTLSDVAQAEVSVNGKMMPLTFACLEQKKWGLLKGLLKHVEKPSILKDREGNPLSWEIFGTLPSLFFDIARKDGDCLLTQSKEGNWPLFGACSSSAPGLVADILTVAREQGNLRQVLDQKTSVVRLRAIDLMQLILNGSMNGLSEVLPRCAIRDPQDESQVLSTNSSQYAEVRPLIMQLLVDAYKDC